MTEQLSTHAHTSQIYNKLLKVNKKKTNDSIIRKRRKFLLHKREYSHGPKQHFKRCSISLVSEETQNPQGDTTTYWPKWWSWVPVAEAYIVCVAENAYYLILYRKFADPWYTARLFHKDWLPNTCKSLSESHRQNVEWKMPNPSAPCMILFRYSSEARKINLWWWRSSQWLPLGGCEEGSKREPVLCLLMGSGWRFHWCVIKLLSVI